ncbi:MAG: hypothetical protein NVS9B10_17420 [Nevskia sp.]
MISLLEGETVDIRCGGCGMPLAPSIGFLQRHRVFVCTCGQRIDLRADVFLTVFDNIETARTLAEQALGRGRVVR